ncbi:hypothetical protein LAV72_18400 [Lysinibacillus xylanilyticus]|uniref:hypothetical protein n=1 Tax=Lysinibacillus TaxID=400634 RepID=UPI002B253226|nr:hypothetical protein [Lysinibacillus xylanilyticus]MEB2301578.1 hypothetical protein [Lysinibacillus xylanilyticus]
MPNKRFYEKIKGNALNPQPMKLNLMSFTMGYQTDEIVMRCRLKNGEYGELRVCEKDIRSMFSWFDLAKQMNE